MRDGRMEEEGKTLEELTALVERLTCQYWGEKHEPLLLTSIARELTSGGIDYRSIVPGRSLKEILRENAIGIEVISHPNIKARVGTIPSGESYTYPEPNDPPLSEAAFEAMQSHRLGRAALVARGPRVRYQNAKSAREILGDFIELLSTLDVEDLEKVVIPTSILAKLSARR